MNGVILFQYSQTADIATVNIENKQKINAENKEIILYCIVLYTTKDIIITYLFFSDVPNVILTVEE